MLESFVKHFPQPLNPAMEARSRLSQIAANAGDFAARDAWLRDIVASDRAAGAQRTDRSRALAAKAAFALAAPAREEFKRIHLVVPLKKSLAEKRKAMEAALKAYAEAADYQVAEVTTAATYESAELYSQLAKDLLSSERPRNLNKDELEQYDVLLEEQAFPFEEKAIKLHEVNAGRAAGGDYDEWVQKSYAALAQLNPGRYGKVEMRDAAAPMPERELTDAETALKAAVQTNPANLQAGNELGIVERRLGKFADAEAAYQHTIAADPTYAPAHLNLGVLYDLYLAEPQKALDEFERYIELAGQNKQVDGWVVELRKRVGAAATKKEPV
jgi:tetratricopeptide (TPR) repeat protein